MEVTQATECQVIHFKPNDTRPFVNRFNDHDEVAKQEATRLVTQYAPSSYKASFADGARWALKQLNG